MSPVERKRLQKLDDLILNASPEELKKIQEIDYGTQMEGLSLYHICVDSSLIINQRTKKTFKKF